MVLFPVPQVATCPGTRVTNPAKSNQHLEASNYQIVNRVKTQNSIDDQRNFLGPLFTRILEIF